MVNTIHYILFLRLRDGAMDQRLVAGLQLTGEFSRPQRAEAPLVEAEDRFYRVPIRAVHHVEDPTEAELPHVLLSFVRRVDAEIVHEDANLVVAVVLAQLLQVFLESWDVKRLVLQLVVFLATLLGNA